MILYDVGGFFLARSKKEAEKMRSKLRRSGDWEEGYSLIYEVNISKEMYGIYIRSFDCGRRITQEEIK